MAGETFKFNLPPGRVVSGSPTFKQDKDPQGNVKKNPSWFMAVAVNKNEPGVVEVINLCINTARVGYQANQLISQRIAAGLKGGFRWKIDDGDDPEDPKNRGKEGWAGCWIFKFNTSLGAIKCCDAQNVEIDPALVKTGYYVDVQASTEINGNVDATAGIYLNPWWVRLLGYGQEITSGPSADQAFSNAPARLPAGASATPVAPNNSRPGGGFGGQGAGFQPQTQGGQPQVGFGGQPQGQLPAPQAGFGGAAPGPQPGGFGGGQPQPQPQPLVPQGPTAEQVAAHYGQQHHPGWRYNPQTNQYDVDAPASPPPVAGPGAQAGVTGHPAPSGGPGFSQGTASPGNAYPGAQPHTGFATGQR